MNFISLLFLTYVVAHTEPYAHDVQSKLQLFKKALVIGFAAIITFPSGIMFVYTHTCLFTRKSPLIGLRICTV